MRVRLDSKVYSDLIEIVEYYDEEAGAELAAEFYAEFRQCARTTEKRPNSFPQHDGLRRVNLNKFPYHFLFQIMDEKELRILIVRHNRRHPDFGLDR